MRRFRRLPQLHLADPALRPLRTRLMSALETGALPAPPPGLTWNAIGEEMAFSGVAGLERTAGEPLLVMEGPTPSDAQRVPASLILLPLNGKAAGGALSPGEVADLILREACDRQATEAPDFAGLWKKRGMSCAATGEKAGLGAGGRSLETLLSGLGQTPPLHPLWAALASACAASAVSLAAVLNHVFTSRTVWFSPYTGLPVTPREAACLLEIMQEHWQSNDLPSHCYGAQYWNHPSIGATFSGKGGDVTFHETQAETFTAARESGGRILSWAGRTDPDFETRCADGGVPLLRIEDGFLRSVGLGAGLARGAMLAVDDLGIYYDPSRPSRLEKLLNDYDLSADERRRGEALVGLIRRARVSKYNFGRQRSYEFPSGKTRVLVPGQVADDAAIRKSRSATIDCANTPNVNLDLLRLARERNPDAFLIFKPHPDVETGLRKGRVRRDEAMRFADHIAEDANIVDLIEAVDAVETFSSLSGFEALLRGRRVAVHGAPFYAGWGLCEDLTPIEGRNRQRSLPELVFLALVKYARTIDPVTLLPCSPEFLVERLSAQRSDRAHLLVTALKRHASWLGRKLGI